MPNPIVTAGIKDPVIRRNFEALQTMDVMGPPGPQGIQGVQGTQGTQGPAGTNGTDGASVTVVISTAAPNNSDGRPDGTIYFKTTA